jgi:hypothetical protein
MKKIMNKAAEMKARIENRVACRRAGCDDLKLDDAGMGTIEIVLIIVVLISLVIIFQKQIQLVLKAVMKTISDGTTEIKIK